ncbi:IS3 family transposase [Dietzia maris]
MTATLAQPTPIPVHDVVRQRVHDVMRSCVLEVMRQDTPESKYRIAGLGVPTGPICQTFFATLKNEMYHQQVFATRARARFAVAEYIEVFYNRRRPHSSIGYRTPARAWNDHHAAQDLSRAA